MENNSLPHTTDGIRPIGAINKTQIHNDPSQESIPRFDAEEPVRESPMKEIVSRISSKNFRKLLGSVTHRIFYGRFFSITQQTLGVKLETDGTRIGDYIPFLGEDTDSYKSLERIQIESNGSTTTTCSPEHEFEVISKKTGYKTNAIQSYTLTYSGKSIVRTDLTRYLEHWRYEISPRTTATTVDKMKCIERTASNPRVILERTRPFIFQEANFWSNFSSGFERAMFYLYGSNYAEILSEYDNKFTAGDYSIIPGFKSFPKERADRCKMFFETAELIRSDFYHLIENGQNIYSVLQIDLDKILAHLGDESLHSDQAKISTLITSLLDAKRQIDKLYTILPCKSNQTDGCTYAQSTSRAGCIAHNMKIAGINWGKIPKAPDAKHSLLQIVRGISEYAAREILTNSPVDNLQQQILRDFASENDLPIKIFPIPELRFTQPHNLEESDLSAASLIGVEGDITYSWTPEGIADGVHFISSDPNSSLIVEKFITSMMPNIKTPANDAELFEILKIHNPLTPPIEIHNIIDDLYQSILAGQVGVAITEIKTLTIQGQNLSQTRVENELIHYVNSLFNFLTIPIVERFKQGKTQFTTPEALAQYLETDYITFLERVVCYLLKINYNTHYTVTNKEEVTKTYLDKNVMSKFYNSNYTDIETEVLKLFGPNSKSNIIESSQNYRKNIVRIVQNRLQQLQEA